MDLIKLIYKDLSFGFYNNGINGNNDFKNKSNNNESSPIGKQNSKLDYMSKINLPLLYKPQNISSKNKFSNNFINETPSTSAYTNSTKNNLRNDHNLTEQVSKFRIGLFSANSSSAWYEGTPRTFTITNCTDVQNSDLTWTVTKKITPPSRPRRHISPSRHWS